MKDNHKILKFSKAFSDKLMEYQKMGYVPSKAKIRFVVWWYCKEDDREYAIFLPALYFGKKVRTD
jgi:ATP-dependent DNA helicase RecQ